MIDRYTKIVLTVIAGALIGLLGQNTIGPLNAQSGVQRVVICDSEDTRQCANLKQVSFAPDRFSLVVTSLNAR